MVYVLVNEIPVGINKVYELLLQRETNVLTIQSLNTAHRRSLIPFFLLISLKSVAISVRFCIFCELDYVFSKH